MSVEKQREPFVSVEEVAKYLSHSPKTIYKYCYQNDFPHYKTGKKSVRFLLSEVEEWLKQRKGA